MNRHALLWANPALLEIGNDVIKEVEYNLVGWDDDDGHDLAICSAWRNANVWRRLYVLLQIQSVWFGTRLS